MGSTVAEAPELGRPSGPKRTLVPAIGGGEHGVDHAAGPGHGALAVVEAQHQEGEDQLQAESPGDGAPADAFAVGRAQPGRQQHGENSQHSGKSIQGELLKKQWSVNSGQ